MQHIATRHVAMFTVLENSHRSLACALFLCVALRRAISCNHGAIKGDVTYKSQPSQSLSLKVKVLKLLSNQNHTHYAKIFNSIDLQLF